MMKTVFRQLLALVLLLSVLMTGLAPIRFSYALTGASSVTVMMRETA